MRYIRYINSNSAEFDGLLQMIERTKTKYSTGNTAELKQHIAEDHDIIIGEFDGRVTPVSWTDEREHFWWTLRWA